MAKPARVAAGVCGACSMSDPGPGPGALPGAAWEGAQRPAGWRPLHQDSEVTPVETRRHAEGP